MEDRKKLLQMIYREFGLQMALAINAAIEIAQDSWDKTKTDTEAFGTIARDTLMGMKE